MRKSGNGRPVARNHARGSVVVVAPESRPLTAEERERTERWATICKLNPDGLTGDAQRINNRKLAFEGQ